MGGEFGRLVSASNVYPTGTQYILFLSGKFGRVGQCKECLPHRYTLNIVLGGWVGSLEGLVSARNDYPTDTQYILFLGGWWGVWKVWSVQGMSPPLIHSKYCSWVGG